MRSMGRFRRLFFVLGTVVVLVATLVGTKLATRPVNAQVATTIDVFTFQCGVIPNTPDFWALGSYHLTRSANANNIDVSNCSQVMADALNAGFHLKSALALPNGGTGGTGATEYVFVRGADR
jgi:hypothetical protein